MQALFGWNGMWGHDRDCDARKAARSLRIVTPESNQKQRIADAIA